MHHTNYSQRSLSCQSEGNPRFIDSPPRFVTDLPPREDLGDRRPCCYFQVLELVHPLMLAPKARDINNRCLDCVPNASLRPQSLLKSLSWYGVRQHNHKQFTLSSFRIRFLSLTELLFLRLESKAKLKLHRITCRLHQSNFTNGIIGTVKMHSFKYFQCSIRAATPNWMITTSIWVWVLVVA